MSLPDRQELIHNAIAFLADPKTQSSSMAQRIQFLEAKGLTAAEIDTAIKQATMNQSTPNMYQAPYPPMYGSSTYSAAQPHSWDWRDYFISAVISGSIAYGAVALFKKYVLPHLQPPSSTVYEADREALTAQFDVAEALLKEIQAQTEAVRTAMEEQKEKVDKATEEVECFVKEIREGESRIKGELKEIREEVDNVRDMLPKMIEKNKDSQTHSLAELQQEMKSLKALLLSRGPGISGSSTPSLPSFASAGRPSIPAWQLNGSSQNPTTTGWEQTHGDLNGKGKEVDSV